MRIFRADFGYHGGVGPEQRGQNAQLMKALMKADYKLPSDVSDPLVDLVSHLIQPDAAKRYTAAEALKHPWCRLLVAWAIIPLNFYIYAEDPIAHSNEAASLPVVGDHLPPSARSRDMGGSSPAGRPLGD